MSSQVHALRKAEKDAMEMIQAARDERRTRLKQAVKDADEEIAEYERQEMERLDRTHPPVSETEKEKEKSSESKQADEKIKHMHKEFEENRQNAKDFLIHVVTNVE
eukprot:gb/GECG01002485.1/.p1 GENE.gb/GECG01002485.1/~~gb/GECG01002485.1/.p1  ORF type:complete len:106 (+),score=29.47 gb/GECG01002485.1/:1-318(+)